LEFFWLPCFGASKNSLGSRNIYIICIVLMVTCTTQFIPSCLSLWGPLKPRATSCLSGCSQHPVLIYPLSVFLPLVWGTGFYSISGQRVYI
jgi:hypothetical protein